VQGAWQSPTITQHLIVRASAFRNDNEKEHSLTGKMTLVDLLSLVERRAPTNYATVLRQAQSGFRVTIPVETDT
jgi:hypothetical protein